MEDKVKLLALIGAGALLGSAATISLFKLLPRAVKHEVIKAVKANGSTFFREENPTMINTDLLSDEVVCEQLTRNIQFFGLDAQQKVTASYVVVIGLGGVGSHAANMLLRSGVGRLLLVDFDQVTVSSLNRHAVATREDVGTPKPCALRSISNQYFQSVM